MSVYVLQLLLPVAETGVKICTCMAYSEACGGGGANLFLCRGLKNNTQHIFKKTKTQDISCLIYFPILSLHSSNMDDECKQYKTFKSVSYVYAV